MNVDDPIVFGKSWTRTTCFAVESKDVYRCEACRNVENFLDNDCNSSTVNKMYPKSHTIDLRG